MRTPGPTPLPAEVRAALARDMVNHRGPEMAAVFRDCVAGLRWALQTDNDVLLLTASGTGGLESAVVNTLSPGQRVLAATAGDFGERFATIARAFGADVVQHAVEWGQAVEPEPLAERLAADPSLETVFVTHNETSTGVMNPLREIAAAVRRVRPDVLLVVDAISSAGSVPLETDAWQCDVVIAGSQKGWMIPPGLAFVSVSPRAWRRQAEARLPRSYWDWAAYKRFLERGSTPATPAVGLLFALQTALGLMRAEGLEQIYARQERLARFTRQGLCDLGLRLFADPAYASWTVTAVWPPDGVEVRPLLRRLHEQHQVVLAGGQGAYADKLFRIGHLGYVTEEDLAVALRALRSELAGAASPRS